MCILNFESLYLIFISIFEFLQKDSLYIKKKVISYTGQDSIRRVVWFTHK